MRTRWTLAAWTLALASACGEANPDEPTAQAPDAKPFADAAAMDAATVAKADAAPAEAVADAAEPEGDASQPDDAAMGEVDAFLDTVLADEAGAEVTADAAPDALVATETWLTDAELADKMDGADGADGAADSATSDAGDASNAPDGTGDAGDTMAGADAGPTPEPTVRFAAFGDSGKANTEQNAVGAAMAQKCKASGCDFVLMLGDNFYPTGVKSENDGQFVDKFEMPYKDVDAPFYVVLGNHDYGGEGAGYELWKGDFYKKYSKKNPKFHHPDNAWDKVVQHVHLFALDSNLMMYGLGAPQVQKYGPLIKNSTATWKLAFAHHPYLSNGKHGNAGAYEGLPNIPIISGGGVKKAYEEILCGKVDLLLSGHDHSRQWLQPSSKCPGVEFIVSGAGASTTEIKTKNFLFTPSPAYWTDAASAGFLWVEIKGKKLHGEFINSAGKVEFSRDFSKP